MTAPAHLVAWPGNVTGWLTGRAALNINVKSEMRGWLIRLVMFALSFSIMCEQWREPYAAQLDVGGTGARKTYLERCAACHGLSGGGDVPQAAHQS